LLDEEENKRRAWTLAALGVGSILLWQTYWGGLLLYPFTILATWFHEMGHGIAAILTGGHFERLAIYSDGSGVSHSLMPKGAPVFSHAFISAAGPLGPAVIGAALIVASRSGRATRIALGALAGALLLSTLIWVRSVVGWLVLPGIGLVLVLVVWRGSSKVRDFAIQLLGVQACISCWHDTGYLFSDGGVVAGQPQRSDTAAIAESLLLPYWFWGAAISALIVALLAASLRFALRP
jgi:hypothetical protein